MKIILASDMSFLLKQGYALTGIPKNDMRIGYVTTASKGARDKSFFEKVKEQIRGNGYAFQEIDIDNVSEKGIRDFFSDKNVIHVEGGNTFYLLKAIKSTKFADILKHELNKGTAYIGTSAGAYIMCPTIEVADWNKTGRDRFGLTDFSALGYVPFLHKVHYKDDAEKEVRENIKTLKYPLRILRDGQGILVEDNNFTFVGGGKEVRLS